MPEACRGLPADEGFTGREPDLAALSEVLAERTDAQGPVSSVVVCTVAGLAGVGKTALAVRSAREFSGRVLFIDLHGFDPGRSVDPTAALAIFLRALGTPDEHIPPEQDAREVLYRSVLTALSEAGDRVLVIADNAAQLSQVLPLRPTGSKHRMIVTSRNNLPIPGARRVEVDVLPAADAQAVLELALRATDPDDTRVADDPAAASELVRLCGYLPLALRIVAELLADQPERTVADLVWVLSAAQDRLGELAYDDSLGVRTAFDASYQRLPDAQRQLFRLMALNPGPHISIAAAAALADEPEDVVRRSLQALRRAHLIQPAPDGVGYGFHDLLRLYADGRCHQEESVDDRADATHRLLDHYRDAAWDADMHLNVRRINDLAEQHSTARFTDRSAALAWLDAQRENLVAAVDLAVREGFDTHAQDLPVCLYAYFYLHKHWDDWVTTSEHGLAAAVRLGDKRGEAAIRNRLGGAYRELDRFDEAIECHTLALTCWQDVGDRRSMGVTLTSLGNAYLDAKQPDEAMRCLQQALDLLTEPSDRPARGITMTSLGNAYHELSRLPEALTCYHQALAINREEQDRHGQAVTLLNLGIAHDRLHQFDAALECNQQALTICQELGDHHGQAHAHSNLSIVYWSLGRRDAAIESSHKALAIFNHLRMPDLARRERAVLMIIDWAEQDSP
ncbi:ATP-binding protein [Actinokineospora soli]|uniref:ATP-binding protein n=1 Tax=Actinokineospora soli TaxID=1048753 RepID=A0ABW2TWS8_9PSEU